MRADRLLRLLGLLQRHGRAHASWLATELEVSERTVLRDMEALSAAGVPVFTERGRHGGCVLLDGFTTDASGLTTSEAEALFAWSSAQSVKELGLGAELTGALAKVAASASRGAMERADALGSVLVADRRRWFAAAEQVPTLPLLRQATRDRRRVRLRYARSGSTTASTRTIDPYGLIDQSGRWYLVAAHRGVLRTYRVSRIESAEVLDAPAQRDDPRSLEAIWADLRATFEARPGAPVEIELMVSTQVAEEFSRVITARVIDQSISREPAGDGWERWRYATATRRLAVAQALAWAPDVRVLGPASLLEAVRRQVRTLEGLYPPT